MDCNEHSSATMDGILVAMRRTQTRETQRTRQRARCRRRLREGQLLRRRQHEYRRQNVRQRLHLESRQSEHFRRIEDLVNSLLRRSDPQEQRLALQVKKLAATLEQQQEQQQQQQYQQRFGGNPSVVGDDVEGRTGPYDGDASKNDDASTQASSSDAKGPREISRAAVARERQRKANTVAKRTLNQEIKYQVNKAWYYYAPWNLVNLCDRVCEPCGIALKSMKAACNRRVGVKKVVVEEYLTQEEKDERDHGSLPLWKRYVMGPNFDSIAGGLIALNAACMALKLEWKGSLAYQQLYDASTSSRLEAIDASERSGWGVFFQVIEHLFCVYFFGELSLRIMATGKKYFRHPSNWVDIICVSFAVIDLWIGQAIVKIYALATGSVLRINLPNIAVVRLVRFAKLAKVLRIIRVMKVFTQLRVLVMSVVNSVGALGWSVVLLTITQSIAAILMTQLVQEVITDEEHPYELRKECYHYFGRFSHSMLTMYQLTLAPGAWAKAGRMLIFEVSPLYALFFIPWGWCVPFALLRVISAMFLKQTLAIAANDPETAITERVKKREGDIRKLRSIFNRADTDHGGFMDQNEFDVLLQDPHLKTFLSVMELEVTDVKGLFDLLDSRGEGCIYQSDFINGIMRMRGAAKSTDIMTILYENKKIQTQIGTLQRDMADMTRPKQARRVEMAKVNIG